MDSKELKNRVYNFSIQIIRFLDSVEVKRIYYSISNQLLRSATSIWANLIEARAAHSRKDFIKFYEIALKSCNETKYWICIFRDGLRIKNEDIKKLLQEADELSKILASSIITLKSNKNYVKEPFETYEFEISKLKSYISNLKQDLRFEI